jgi:hypothetical protein
MVYFKTRSPVLAYFGRSLNGKLSFVTIGFILWQFGIFCGLLIEFPHFGTFVSRKIWQPRCQR